MQWEGKQCVKLILHLTQINWQLYCTILQHECELWYSHTMMIISKVEAGSQWLTFALVNIFANDLFTVIKNSIRQLIIYSDTAPRIYCCFAHSKSMEALWNLKFLSFFGQCEGGIPTYCTSIMHSMTAVYCYVCILASLSIPGPKLLTCYYRVATKGHSRCHLNNWNHWQSYSCGTQTA